MSQRQLLAAELARPGWQCEFTVHTSGVDGGCARLGARGAGTPEQALVWMRLSVRELVSGFAPEDCERAYRWLEYGQWEAVYLLRSGEPYRFTARFETSVLEWSARPVVFVPLASSCLRETPNRSAGRPVASHTTVPVETFEEGDEHDRDA